MSHSLAQIEDLLGTPSGPTGYSRGDLSPLKRIQVRSCWVMELAVDRGHPGTAGLDAAITSLPVELADSMSAARRQGCDVVLSVLQCMSAEGLSEDLGLHLSSGAVAWLGRAGAVVDVDQYIEGE